MFDIVEIVEVFLSFLWSPLIVIGIDPVKLENLKLFEVLQKAVGDIFQWSKANVNNCLYADNTDFTSKMGSINIHF